MLVSIILIALFACESDKGDDQQAKAEIGKQWSEARAQAWYSGQPWMIGSNFNPSTSINQLEFWQAESFDPETIDRELGWAADLGFNLMRVYLHNLLWAQDSTGFLQRMEKYLEISGKHGIKTMFVLLDDVWDPSPHLGKQRDPRPHVHNSGWVQAPGAEILGDSSRHKELKPYIQGVLSHFANDSRVLMWDLYNEPDNRATGIYPETEIENKHDFSYDLARKVMKWAREMDPSQPLTMGIWRGEIEHWGDPDSLPAVDKFMVEQSDIISFHAYDGSMEDVKKKVEELRTYNRPMICTEYLARGRGNGFTNVFTYFKSENIGAINWGLVSGKTQTIYPWKSWDSAFVTEPKVWHHDIFRDDGSPFDPEEIKLIRELTGKTGG